MIVPCDKCEAKRMPERARPPRAFDFRTLCTPPWVISDTSTFGALGFASVGRSVAGAVEGPLAVPGPGVLGQRRLTPCTFAKQRSERCNEWRAVENQPSSPLRSSAECGPKRAR
jgi:hypothetical protein